MLRSLQEVETIKVHESQHFALERGGKLQKFPPPRRSPGSGSRPDGGFHKQNKIICYE